MLYVCMVVYCQDDVGSDTESVVDTDLDLVSLSSVVASPESSTTKLDVTASTQQHAQTEQTSVPREVLLYGCLGCV